MADNIVQLHPNPGPDAFDRFWDIYPKKSRYGGARRQWMWALAATNNDAEVIIAGAKAYANHCRRNGIEQQYILNPQNWLADECWRDVYDQPSRGPEPSEEARIRALHAQWWGGQDNPFKAAWRRDRISEADKAAMKRLGLI